MIADAAKIERLKVNQQTNSQNLFKAAVY